MIEITRRHFLRFFSGLISVSLLKSNSASASHVVPQQTRQVCIAAEMGKSALVASHFTAMGGRVDYVDEEIAIVEGWLPQNCCRPDRPLPGAVAMFFEEDGPPSSPAVSVSEDLLVFQRALIASAPGDQDHLQFRIAGYTAGLDRFRRLFPSFDGRGVVVAHIEHHGDFLAPELAVSVDIDGHTVEKFRKITSFPDYEGSTAVQHLTGTRNGSIRVELCPPIARIDLAHRLRVQADALPEDVEWFQIGAFVLRGSMVDALRSVHAIDDAKQVEVHVLWCVDSRCARIATGHLANTFEAEAVALFEETKQFGVMSLSDHSDKRFGFALHCSSKELTIHFGTRGHATMVATTLAGNTRPGGLAEGVAPGAQLVAMSIGRTAGSLIRALGQAFRDRDVDIVMYENATAIDLVRYVDGQSVAAVALQRLTDLYDKPCFVTALNGAGIGHLISTHAPKAFVVGAAQERAWTENVHGQLRTVEIDISQYTAEGPATDGDLKPSFLAPTGFVSSVGRPEWPVFERSNESLVPLPNGYIFGGGSSQATPVATGIAACLLSAVRQLGRTLSRSELAEALSRTAIRLPRAEARQQGCGSLSVLEAWRYLSAPTRDPIDVVEVLAPVAVKGRTSAFGRGLFEREGWSIGDRRSRRISLRRISGPEGLVPYRLKWRFDERAFTSASDVLLPLAEPVHIEIHIAPAGTGSFSNILEVERLADGVTVCRVLCTIIVPIERLPGQDLRIPLNIDEDGRSSVFVRMPTNVRLQLKVSGVDEFIYSIAMSPNLSRVPIGMRESGVRIVETECESGVWEFYVQDFRRALSAASQGGGASDRIVELTVSEPTAGRVPTSDMFPFGQ